MPSYLWHILVNYSALEHFMRKQPDCINIRNDDGYTALHLASLNDHLDVVTALVDVVRMTPSTI